jgi:hypothetical protein
MARIEVTCLFLCDEIWLVISSAQTTCVYEFSEFGLWKNHVYFTCIVRLFETLSYCLLGWASWILTS